MNLNQQNMTQRELMQELRISNTGFWKLAKAGKLPPSFQVGSRKRWNRETVRQWMQNQEQECLNQIA